MVVCWRFAAVFRSTRLYPYSDVGLRTCFHLGIIAVTVLWSACTAEFQASMSFDSMFDDVDQMIFFDPS
jgi:hypothetical protein